MRTLASRMAVMSGEGALSVYARAKELEKEGRSIIHLELGEPDFHPAPLVNAALIQALQEGKDRYCAVAGVPAPYISAAFHNTLAAATSAAVRSAARRVGHLPVIASGGCFHNARLAESIVGALDGFDVWLHRDVPPGDGLRLLLV